MTDDDIRAASQAGWTLETLYQAFNNRITDLEKRLDERAESQQRAIDASQLASDKAVAAALASAEKAVMKADASQQRVNETMSDFKDALRDQAITLMPRSETETISKSLDAKIEAGDKALQEKIDLINKILDTNQGKSEGIKLSVGMLTTVVMMVAAFSGGIATLISQLVH